MNSSRISVALIIAVAGAAIAGCGNTGGSTGWSTEPSTIATVPQPEIRFARPNGQKKIGPYVWLWQSKVLTGEKVVQIKAECPANDVVLGGGYGASNGYGHIYYSHPNTAFDGWVITANGGYHPVVVTVFASCAPAK